MSSYEIKYQTPQSGNNVGTTSETANSESEAKAKVLKRIAKGSKIISVKKK
jgi:hypothetical protein